MSVKNGTFLILNRTYAQVAELVDALVLGTSDFGRVGSSPSLGTIFHLYLYHYSEDEKFMPSAVEASPSLGTI